MASEWIAGIIGAASGGAVSYFYNALSQYKSEKPSKYNSHLDELKSLTKSFNNLCIQYWSSKEFDNGARLNILATRSEIYATISYINNMQDFFDPQLLKNKYTLYTTALTTSPFGNENHLPDSKRVEEAIESLQHCLTFIESKKYKINHWVFWKNSGLK